MPFAAGESGARSGVEICPQQRVLVSEVFVSSFARGVGTGAEGPSTSERVPDSSVSPGGGRRPLHGCSRRLSAAEGLRRGPGAAAEV